MSLGTDAAANKRAALEQLRFNKTKRLRQDPQIISAPSQTSLFPHHQLPYAPPVQSRDATIPSRFQPTTPNHRGVILAPDSSPLGPDLSFRPQYPSVPNHYDVAPVSSFFNPQGGYGGQIDPLSAPSGFTNGPVISNLARRARVDDDVFSIENGPPRKRMNVGPSPTHHDSPGSPDVQGPGQRRFRNGHINGLSTSSDDSIPDVRDALAGPSRPRIVRGERPNSPKPPPSDISQSSSDEKKFMRFSMTMPTHSPAKVRVAWNEAGQDVKKATAFLSDPSWKPRVVSPTRPADTTGRIKALEDTKAQRVATKEKGKKSMIYANRSALEAIPPPPLSVSTMPAREPTVDLTVESPVVAPRRKRAKLMVLDSDSDLTESEDDGLTRATGSEENLTEMRALEYFNSAQPETLQELTGCSVEQAKTIIDLRPYPTLEVVNSKLKQGKKKAGPGGISPRIFEDCMEILDGYGRVDSILEDCEKIGSTLRKTIASWAQPNEALKGKEGTATPLGGSGDGALCLDSLALMGNKMPKDFFSAQPALLAENVQLKDYQLLGVNWLNLLYRKNLSCILADEMGLGKTIQVISFFALLKEKGSSGPHLVVVPSSTLENWCREFAKFAPSISVQTYYAGKEERPALRQTLLDTLKSSNKNGEAWEVLITTYNLAQGDERDRKFFRKIDWDTCVFDEGHVLKNFQSQRYQSLVRIGSRWRLLLTGTPLQNNLQELVSLMNFILPLRFADALESLRAIFKVKGDHKVSLLSQERVSRAKKMMTPFVLRRRKDQVLKDLPKKTERIEWCEMTALQKQIYHDTLLRSRKTVLDLEEEAQAEGYSLASEQSKPTKKKSKINTKAKEKMYLENSSNVLMDLRKAALHPMLFRTRFDDQVLTNFTKQLLKEPDFKKRGALFEVVKEDMTVMTDAELQVYAATYKSTCKFLQDESCYLDAGKVTTLLSLLSRYKAEERKVLIFSQFTQVLDILQAILNRREIKYLLLTGSTAVDVRQSLVDEFTDDESIDVFLLSTKAGGMGINLTASSVVILFDQDFNPHNDRQAQDRAYRIGQKRDVDVIKLITRGTIEEDMLRLGETKLALDEAVAGENEDEKGESAPEREMKQSLMKVLRQQFEQQQEGIKPVE